MNRTVVTLGVALIAVTFTLGLLVYRAERSLSATDHEHMVEAIQHSQIWEARLDEPLMAVHLGITRHYDELTARLRAQQATLTVFETDPRLRAQVEMSGVHPRIAAIQHLLDVEEQAIERFKRHFALLRNSGRYVPTLLVALADEAAQGGQGELADALNRLLRAALIYNAMPSLEFEQDLRAQLEALRGQHERLPATFGEALRLVEKHTLILLTERSNARALIREVLDLPMEFLYQDLLRAYQSWYGQRLAAVTRYQYALGVSSVALAGYLGFLLWQFLRSRAAMRASERHLRNILDGMFVFIGVMTPEGILTEVNRASLQALQMKREDFIGQAWAEGVWFSPSTRQRARAAVARAAQGEIVRLDEEVFFAAGVRWFDIALAPIMDARRRITHLIASGIDITERKRAEDALRASEQHLRNLLDSLYVFVGVMTPDGIMTEVNRAPLQLAGLTREDVIGKPVEQAFWFSHSPDARARIRSAITRAARGELVRYDDQVRMAAGPMWIDIAVAPLMDEQGKVTHLVPLGVDITQRKYAENAIRESQERLQIFINYAPVAMALFDHNMRYLAVSRRWLEVFSLGERDIIGCSHYEIFPDVPQRWREAYRRGLAGEVVKADMDCFPRQDGTEQWMRWEIRPWHGSDGSVGGIVIFIEDITVRRQAEAEILRLNAELEQRVQQRTAELATLNKELEAFSYSVSHDLRAPLRAMHGFSAALAEDCGGQLDESCHSYVDRIQKASEKMSRLIDDMLQLSRITRAELSLGPVDLCALVRQVAEGLRQRDPGRSIELLIPDICPAWGDARLLSIALENLFSNAWKFTRHQPQPRIEFGVLRQNGETVYFVRDNGAGFDMAYADKLFKAFQRLHTDQQFEGTGIGLSIVQRVIHRHGGHVWAQAEQGKGATFYFTLANGGHENETAGAREALSQR